MTTTPICPACNEPLELIGNRPLVQGYQVRDYRCAKCQTTSHHATHWDHALTAPNGPIYHE